MSRPDFARLVLERLGNPSALKGEHDASAIGAIILGQLQRERSPDANPYRISALGKCAKQLAFANAGHPSDGRQIDGRAVSVFALGDMAEALLVVTLREALLADGRGWALEDVQHDAGQAAVTLHVGEIEIPGHPDGLLRGPDVSAVLECKSMSSYAFSRFEEAGGFGPEDSYWWQAQGYAHALGLPVAYVLALCKDSGYIAGAWLDSDAGYMDRLAEHLAASKRPPGAVARVLPDGTELRPAEKLGAKGQPIKGHGKLPWQCVYCPYFRPCWRPEGLREAVGRDYRGRPSTELYVGGGE
jgi:hypothetical protein